jgi:phosphohistidine phosphatase
MKLYLIQHAEACSKDSNPERPLTEKGKADANRMAVFLRQAGVSVEKVMHSGKLRARQTTERLINAIAQGIDPEISPDLNPDDDPNTLAQQALAWKLDTLIVGHMPYLARLVSQLLLRDSKSQLVQYSPGTVICLERTLEYRWELSWMMKPELLK